MCERVSGSNTGIVPGGAETAFVALVESARESNWIGKEAEQLLNHVLPALARPLGAEFPELLPDEVLSWVWEVTKRPSLSSVQYPRTWVIKGVRKELISVVRAQRDGVAPEKVSAKGWWKERVAFVGDSAGLMITGPQADEHLTAITTASMPLESDNTDNALSSVWEDLRDLLVRLQWPFDVASRAVLILETNQRSAARELNFLPWGYATALVRFTFANPGFVWARLHGINVDRAVLLAAAETDLLEGLVWTPVPSAVQSVSGF